MNSKWLTVLLYISLCFICSEQSNKLPMILVALLARNKEYCLPYFLTLFNKLNYPKNRLSLFIRADHCHDKTIDILEEWLEDHRAQYAHVNADFERTPVYHEGENKTYHRSDSSVFHVANLKNDALEYAQLRKVKFLWFLDVDVFITNPNILQEMIKFQKPISAPMLQSIKKYSNFWSTLDDEYETYFDEYFESISERNEVGCFKVRAVIESMFLNMDMIKGKFLSFHPHDMEDYGAPYISDYIAFSESAMISGVPIFICNQEHYGYVMHNLGNNSTSVSERGFFNALRLEVAIHYKNFTVEESLRKYLSKKYSQSKLGLDEIYYINLDRRPERNIRMQQMLDILGLEGRRMPAVDGRTINKSSLKKFGVKVVPGYIDFFEQRPMTVNEVGCFLSHYNIWKDIAHNKYEKAMVMEDDVFLPYTFRRNLRVLLAELEVLELEWDFIYLIRKKMTDFEEQEVYESSFLLSPEFSYWAAGYLISQSGARKLLRANPLKRLIPVDEFLPIMYDSPLHRYGNDESLVKYFPKRDLIALALKKDILELTYFNGDKQYVSDTTDSILIPDLYGLSYDNENSTCYTQDTATYLRKNAVQLEAISK